MKYATRAKSIPIRRVEIHKKIKVVFIDTIYIWHECTFKTLPLNLNLLISFFGQAPEAKNSSKASATKHRGCTIKNKRRGRSFGCKVVFRSSENSFVSISQSFSARWSKDSCFRFRAKQRRGIGVCPSISPIGAFIFARKTGNCTSVWKLFMLLLFFGGGGFYFLLQYRSSFFLLFIPVIFALKMVKMQGGIIYQTRSTKIFGRAWATVKANCLIFTQSVE